MLMLALLLPPDADLDCQLVSVDNGCVDRDPGMHWLLTDKAFPRQDAGVSTNEIVEALAAL